MTKTRRLLNKIFDYLIMFLYKILVDEKNHNYTDKTVYKAPSSHICSENLDPANLNNFNINKTKPENTKTISKPKQIKNSIIDWVASFNHTHFLTLQLPNSMKTDDSDTSNHHLRKIMAEFQRQLLGKHWNKKHLSFMAFAEKGKSEGWHYHIVFDGSNFTTEELQVALNKAAISRKLSPSIFYLETINHNKNKLYSYCTKEMKIKNNYNFNCDNIILSGDLFNI